MLEIKCLGTVRFIVCITATFTQQTVGQIVLGRVICTATMLKIFWTGLQSCFSSKVRFLVRSKKIGNDQELIQSDPISCPQNQKGNN